MWELFVPNIGAGTRYKFQVIRADGRRVLRRTPWRGGPNPRRRRRVVERDDHVWADGSGWPGGRRNRCSTAPSPSTRCTSAPGAAPRTAPSSATASWRRSWSAYCGEMGFTHVELLPATEHPFNGSWGYQVTGYFAPTSRFGTPEDFLRLRRPPAPARHRRPPRLGAGTLPQGRVALARFDGTALYEHADPRRGEHPRLGHAALQLRPQRGAQLPLANALYWLDEFHVDGLRVDAVASMLYLDYSPQAGPVDPQRIRRQREPGGHRFLQRDQRAVHARHPGVHDDCRGVHVLARRHPPDLRWAASASASSGTWAGCTTPWIHAQGPRLPALPPQPD